MSETCKHILVILTKYGFCFIDMENRYSALASEGERERESEEISSMKINKKRYIASIGFFSKSSSS